MVRDGMSASRARFCDAAADWQHPRTSKPAACQARAAARSIVVFPLPAQPSRNAASPVPQATCIAAARCCDSDTSTPSLERSSASSRSNSSATKAGSTRCATLALPAATRSLTERSRSSVERDVKSSAISSVRPSGTNPSKRMNALSSARHSAADQRPIALSQISARASCAVETDCSDVSSESSAARSIANGSAARAGDLMAATDSGVMPSDAARARNPASSSGSGGSAFEWRVANAAAWRAKLPAAPAFPARSEISRLRVERASRWESSTPRSLK